MKIHYLFLFLTCFLISCATTSKQVLLEDYQNYHGNEPVSIMTIELDVLYDQFPDHIFGALRPSERNILDSQLLQIFSSQTYSPLTGKFSRQDISDFNFEKREFVINNSTIEMVVPEPGSTLKTHNFNARFVVILDHFHFTEYEVEVGGGTYAGHEDEVQPRVRFDTNYIIWDNEIGDAIAWGKVSSNQRLNIENRSLMYKELLTTAMGKIVKVSPFRPV